MLWEEQSQARRYRFASSSNTFTKTEIRSWTDVNSIAQSPWRSAERLINEFISLEFVAARTTIPVPRPIRLEYLEGCLSLTTEFIDGVQFDQLPPQLQSVSYLDDYVRNHVLPQLQTLKSDTSGERTGVIIPPRRVFDHDPTTDKMPNAIRRAIFSPISRVSQRPQRLPT